MMLSCASMTMTLLLAAPPAPAGRPRSATDAAERAAAEAVELSARDPRGALERARRALAATVEFEPTAFVTAGRKGEVVEDAFLAARRGYARHRAILYEAVGTVLARQGRWLPASRYLRRAVLLDPTAERGLALARALTDLGRGRDALEAALRATSALAALPPAAAEVIARAADVAGLPSAQAEIDRSRLKAALGDAVTLREGPLELPPGVRVSNAPVFRLAEAPLTVIYAAEATCRSCSADLDELGRQVPRDVRVVALPQGDDQDAALRQVIALYRRPWPVLLGHRLAAQLALAPRSILLVARGGWTLAVLKPPFGAEVRSAITALQHTDLQEQPPRAQWNHRPPDRSPLPSPPALLAEGIAPGEDEPFPAEFQAAVSAFRAGRPTEALKLFDALEARGDGWLLPPEARLDRALCLAAGGQRDAARRLLLRTGDSRFQDAVDRLLEKVAQGR
ncbi:MAG: tetratricopeptide repeat protein [Betaproteobacteria bacterium]